MRIRVEKRGIRAFGIAESFRVGSNKRSVLAGVVIRSDRIVDGVIFGSTTIGGNDATDVIIGMYDGLRRNDINVFIIGGAVISLYNIIDVDTIALKTQTPVISVTFKESEGLETHIMHHFPGNWEIKLETYRHLGGRERIKLKTGYDIYIRVSGITSDEARRTLDKFTIQGSIPEPIRLARILAKAKLDCGI